MSSDGYDVGSDSEFDESTKPLSRAELQYKVLDGVRKKGKSQSYILGSV